MLSGINLNDSTAHGGYSQVAKGAAMVRRAATPAQRAEALYTHAVAVAQAAAPRFRLRAGQAVLVDNYRVHHGRDAYRDLGRRMWRLWHWTKGCGQVPADATVTLTAAAAPGRVFTAVVAGGVAPAVARL